MKNFLILLLILLIANSCEYKSVNHERSPEKLNTEYQEIIKDSYELSKPNESTEAVLILFGGFPEEASDIQSEFKILPFAKNNGIAVLYMNYNQKLWLEQNDKTGLAEHLQKIFTANNLPFHNVYFGGFSSGGNIALLISNYMHANGNYEIQPKGVFIVDSPVDLAELYRSSRLNVKRNFSETAVREGQMIINLLETHFGNPDKDIIHYQKHSIFTLETRTIDNLKNLKNTKIRLYTEPDLSWWKKDRGADYEQLNTFQIKNLSEALHESDFNDVEYITTTNRGYRANGTRHPHSWSIVNEQDLINWMLN